MLGEAAQAWLHEAAGVRLWISWAPTGCFSVDLLDPDWLFSKPVGLLPPEESES